ncbi:hypothetical protein Tco_1229083 [Tanacetum coccineum]
MLSKHELSLEQSQQGDNEDALLTLKGLKKWKRIEWIRGYKEKPSDTTLCKKPGPMHNLLVLTKMIPILKSSLKGPVMQCTKPSLATSNLSKDFCFILTEISYTFPIGFLILRSLILIKVFPDRYQLLVHDESEINTHAQSTKINNMMKAQTYQIFRNL